MASLFTKIIRGEIPCHKVAEDADNFAFMEIAPLKPGHVLAIPKAEVDAFYDLSDEQLKSLMTFAKKVARAIKEAVPCEKVGTIVYGLEVRHAHVHLVPVDGTKGELDFSTKKRATDEELSSMAAKIRSCLR